MIDGNDDMVFTDHQIDDTCPVNDLLIEAKHNQLSLSERRHLSKFNEMQETAIDEYFRILEQTGDVAKAQEAFFEIQRSWYAGN